MFDHLFRWMKERIKELKPMELKSNSNAGIALKRDEAKISILGVSDQPGIAGQLFHALRVTVLILI